MTIEKIITHLDSIANDAWYNVSGSEIELTINDFDGFDENWNEVERELVDADAVDAVLAWLVENADEVTGDFYRYYHFGGIVVCVGWTSYDI